jgi:hypothetical protein
MRRLVESTIPKSSFVPRVFIGLDVSIHPRPLPPVIRVRPVDSHAIVNFTENLRENAWNPYRFFTMPGQQNP